MQAEQKEGSAARMRVLPFEGGCNFRDIGGYATHDGRTVHWGRVYRAGVLSYFSDNDRGALAQLGVRAICDLRRAEEREREPTRWPGESIHALAFDDGIQSASVVEFVRANPTVQDMRNAMIRVYRTLPAWMGARLYGLFQSLAHGKMPLIVHCSAGKDRTGVAIAILLSALGVSRDTVFEDYLLTNSSSDFEAFLALRHGAQLGLGNTEHPLLSLPAAVRAELFRADPEYLQAAFDNIDAKHGGVDAYLTALGIDNEMRQRIEAALLI